MSFYLQKGSREIGPLEADNLVALLQAYVFAVLTCMYLNDALHPSH